MGISFGRRWAARLVAIDQFKKGWEERQRRTSHPFLIIKHYKAKPDLTASVVGHRRHGLGC
jgi:hypothetical protein